MHLSAENDSTLLRPRLSLSSGIRLCDEALSHLPIPRVLSRSFLLYLYASLHVPSIAMVPPPAGPGNGIRC